MKKTYNKLVRDKIPEIILASGETPKTRVLEDKEYAEELIKKLREELAEFEADRSIEELADIQEVILAIADVLGSREELERVRTDKAKKRGGFKKRIFLETTS